MTLETTQNPRVTVLMPVYNGEKHVAEAVESILGQTFRDFEFLIIDDGSTDRSAQIIGSFADPRIRLLPNETNSGLIFSLNRGMEAARGEYVARMDCDDISLPERLARQVAFLDAHPEIGICGSWFRKFGAVNGKTVRWSTDPDSIRCGLLFDSMVGHPTVMLRRELTGDSSLCYDPAFKDAEDYDLWVRAAERCELANLGEVLLQYRVHPGQITQRLAVAQRDAAGRVRVRQLRRMGIEPTEAEMEIHQAISTCICTGVDGLFPRAERWLCRLKEINDRTGAYPEPAFSRTLVDRWLTFCKKGIEQGVWSARVLYFPDLMRATGLGRGYLVSYVMRRLRGD